MPSPPRTFLYAAQVGLIALAYWGAARLSLPLAIPPGYATAIWPAAGIALAGLLMLGARAWPGVWIGALAANLSVAASAPVSALIATGSALQAVAAASMVRQLIGVPYRFERAAQVLQFAAAAALCSSIAPTFALVPLAAGHELSARQLLWNWATWWQGDVLGMLLVAPLVLSWSIAGSVKWTPRKALEAALVAALLAAAAEFAFTGNVGRPFLVVPLLAWVAFRFGQREVVTAVALVCLMASWYTLRRGVGPFAGHPIEESLVLLLLFTCTMVGTGLILSAVLWQLERAMLAARRRAEGMLLDSERRFRLMVESVVDYAIFMLDAEGRVASWNAGAERILGYQADEGELIRAKVAAEKASEAKSQFLANMSHELRTPLNSLLILARLLADNPGSNLSAKQVQFAQTIHASGMDLLSLINDLLDLAKIESGAIASLNFAPARLDELGQELERGFRQLAQDKGLQFSISIDAATPATIRTDVQRVKQVLKNLLANAFKFTRKGGVTLRIAPDAAGWIAFSVTDTGIGIPRDKQEIIFEAFQQADGTTSRQYGGTGLGLSISRELTRLLGGEIGLVSEQGRGSTFTLRLPVAPA
jgi:signal transduction histidine kinase